MALCLPNFKLYGLFVRMLISLTNAYASCGRLTLNFIECLWLGSVCSASKLNSKCTQTNYEINCITICTNVQKCTLNYVLQTAQVHWRVPVLLLVYNVDDNIEYKLKFILASLRLLLLYTVKFRK